MLSGLSEKIEKRKLKSCLDSCGIKCSEKLNDRVFEWRHPRYGRVYGFKINSELMGMISCNMQSVGSFPWNDIGFVDVNRIPDGLADGWGGIEDNNIHFELPEEYIADAVKKYIPAFVSMLDVFKKYNELLDKDKEAKKALYNQPQSSPGKLNSLEVERENIHSVIESFYEQMRKAYVAIEDLRASVELKFPEEEDELDLESIKLFHKEAESSTSELEAISKEILTLQIGQKDSEDHP
jgi:hypothetical protein